MTRNKHLDEPRCHVHHDVRAIRKFMGKFFCANCIRACMSWTKHYLGGHQCRFPPAKGNGRRHNPGGGYL